MNKKQIIEKLNSHGIYQLNKGESVADALDHVDNRAIRKGYKYRHNSGRLMSDNEIIMNENKVAFMKTVSPKEYRQDEVDDIDDICIENDNRQDETERGVIANCHYCGICLRVDADGHEDYEIDDSLIHCEGCMKNAIAKNCM